MEAKTQQTNSAAAQQYPVKLVKEYVDKSGAKKQIFTTVGYLREAKGSGKVAFYLDLNMFDAKYIVFKDDGGDTAEKGQ